MIPADDILQAYIEADAGQRGMVSEILSGDYNGSIYAVVNRNGDVSVFVTSDPNTGHNMTLSIIDVMKEQFGASWVRKLLKSLKKTYQM